jgi:hypothetical protein
MGYTLLQQYYVEPLLNGSGTVRDLHSLREGFNLTR